MPYTNNNFQNGIGLGYQNPIKKAFLNKNENSIIEAFNKQYQNYKRSVHSQPQVSPPKATTFMDGVKANLQRFGNDLEYLSAEIQKKSAGEEFFTDVISKLQNFYNGNLAKQPIHELRQRMRKIEDDNYEVPFPSMNPTHAISLRQPRSMESSVEYDMLKKIVTMKEKGYSNDYIKNWLDDLYHVGGEGTKRQKEVLRKAEKIPESEGWGKVGDVATGLLDILIPIAGGLVNPALGTGLMSLSLGKGLSQNIASANKEIDLYEKNTNQKVSDADRRTYVLGVAATDMLLGSIMQTRYLKNIDLPLVGALRKSLFNKLLNNKQAITEFNHLFRNSLKQSVPKILNKSGQMAVEQAGASGTSALARNMLGMVYKDSEHYPSLNEIVKDVTNEALYGAATGAVTGGISKGLGILTKPNISKSRITPYKLNLPDNPLFDLEGLTPQGYLDRENKIKQIIKDNFKSKSSYANDLPAENRLPLTEQYKLNLPDNPLFDIGEMSLKEYNELVPQLRSALREYYLPKDIQPDNLPAENRLPLSEQYKLKLPDNPLFDMEGLSLNEWLEREAKIKDILKENYIPTPPKRDISLPYKLNLPDNPLFDLEGLTPQGYLDRENKIKQIIKDNFKSKSSYADDLPAENRLPLTEQYKLNLPDNPLFDIGEMSLKEYNELVPQLRSALREYYLPKDIQPDNLPAENRLPLSEQYKLKLPDNPLFDMEGLSLNEWLEREAKIKDILKENYIPTPPKRDISGYNTSLHDDLSQKDIWQEGELGNEYSNSLKRSLVKEEGDKLNIRTRMFNNLGELPEGYKKYLDDHSYSKGFYNPETEEVVIIGNNIASHSDLQNILIQKAYESKGLEDVLGNELDNLLEEVYNNMSNRDSKVYSQNGDTSRKVALSYISDLAKNPRINPEEWNRLSSYVRDLFKTKYNIQNLTDETIKNLLWRTANQITGDDSIEEMIRKSR